MLLVVGVLLTTGCSKNAVDDINVKNARKAVSKFYEFHFVALPERKIVYNDELSTDSKFAFEIAWDFIEKQQDNTDDEIIYEILYVEKKQDVYAVYNENGDQIFTCPF